MYWRNQFSVIRIRVPGPTGEPRRSRKGEAHPASVKVLVRSLFETTRLTFCEIREKTGVDGGTISRWARAGGWQRPPGAWKAHPRRNPTPPPPRPQALARQIFAEAERLVLAVQSAPTVDPAALREAVQLLLDARAVRRHFPTYGARRPPAPPLPERFAKPPEPDPPPDAGGADEAVPSLPDAPRRRRRRDDDLPSPHRPEVLEAWKREKALRRRRTRLTPAQAREAARHAWMMEKVD